MKVLQEITVPQESVNDQSLIVLELYFKNGDKVAKGALIAELETSKTTVTVEAEQDGYVQYFCNVGDDLEVNSIIARISDEIPVIVLEENKINLQKQNVVAPHYSSQHSIKETIFSKKALLLMVKSNIQKTAFVGMDFVSEKDVENILGGSTKTKKVAPISAKDRRESENVVDDISKVQLEKVKSFKHKEIGYLSSVQSAGLVSVINAMVEVEGVIDYINQYTQYFKNSLLPIVVYECGRLLQKYPAFNAYFNNENIAYYKQVHVGFAVDMGKGLKVLKIANTENKSIREIEQEIFQLSNDYLDEKIKTDVLTDITFTITDLSGEDVFSFTPLINMKNSAILGISSIDQKLKRCVLSLAFDHRVTEGKNASVFLSELKQRIESYRSKLFDAGLQSKYLSGIKCYKCMKRLTEDLSDAGFAKCITPLGEEAYICQACFKGF
ncbi:MAG: 2-oxo acid dehydrogenase subunit E2 [Cyclobacteriaceae bacterium]